MNARGRACFEGGVVVTSVILMTATAVPFYYSMPGYSGSSGWHGCLDLLCPANASATSNSRVENYKRNGWHSYAHTGPYADWQVLIQQIWHVPLSSTADANKKGAFASARYAKQKGKQTCVVLHCIAWHCFEADSALLTMVGKVHAQEWRQQFAEMQVLILVSTKCRSCLCN